MLKEKKTRLYSGISWPWRPKSRTLLNRGARWHWETTEGTDQKVTSRDLHLGRDHELAVRICTGYVAAIHDYLLSFTLARGYEQKP